MQQDPTPISVGKRKRYISAYRNRRRADRLPAKDLRAVQQDFMVRRNTEDVARDHMLPRAEAVDAVLIGHGAQIRFLCDQVDHIRQVIGRPVNASGGLLLEPRGPAAELTVREALNRDRKAS